MANLGYILKESVMSSCEGMDDKEFRDTITGLFRYAAYGEEPNFTTELQKVVFKMEKPSIDYNNSKWKAKKQEWNSVNGNFCGKVEEFYDCDKGSKVRNGISQGNYIGKIEK